MKRKKLSGRMLPFDNDGSVCCIDGVINNHSRLIVCHYNTPSYVHSNIR